MSGEDKEILSALQEFKTNFELAKAATAFPLSAGSSPKDKGAVSPSNPRQRDPPALEIPKVLANYLKDVSKTGTMSHPWKVIKPLFLYKLDEVIRWYNTKQSFDKLPPLPNSRNQTFKDVYTTIVKSVDLFKQAPFTIQRLCELICDPELHYKRIDKFLHALEKNTTVVTTVDEMGRKLSTAAEVDLTVTDPQQTSRLLALFDWINYSLGDSTSSDETSSNTESPCTPNKGQSNSISDQATENATPSSRQTLGVQQDQKHTVTPSITSTVTEAKAVEPETRNAKRSLCDDSTEESEDTPRKKVKVEAEVEDVTHTREKDDSKTAGDTSESVTDTSADGENDQSVSEDDSEKTSEGIDDDLNQLPPMESVEQPEPEKSVLGLADGEQSSASVPGDEDNTPSGVGSEAITPAESGAVKCAGSDPRPAKSEDRINTESTVSAAAAGTAETDPSMDTGADSADSLKEAGAESVTG